MLTGLDDVTKRAVVRGVGTGVFLGTILSFLKAGLLLIPAGARALAMSLGLERSRGPGR